MGLRSSPPCLSALLDVFDSLMNLIYCNFTTGMIHMDFSRAFDKVIMVLSFTNSKTLGSLIKTDMAHYVLIVLAITSQYCVVYLRVLCWAHHTAIHYRYIGYK